MVKQEGCGKGKEGAREKGMDRDSDGKLKSLARSGSVAGRCQGGPVGDAGRVRDTRWGPSTNHLACSWAMLTWEKMKIRVE